MVAILPFLPLEPSDSAAAQTLKMRQKHQEPSSQASHAFNPTMSLKLEEKLCRSHLLILASILKSCPVRPIPLQQRLRLLPYSLAIHIPSKQKTSRKPSSCLVLPIMSVSLVAFSPVTCLTPSSPTLSTSSF